MSRRDELIGISDSRTDKRFRFSLQNASAGLHTMRFAPSGWENAKFEIKRNEKYFGLFKTLSFNELIFVKDARDYIQNVYELQGINAAITFTVDRLGNDGVYATYFTGKLDLSTYKIDETGATCQVVDSSFAEKVKNRENLKVNIFDQYTVNGGLFSPFYNAIFGYEADWRLELAIFQLFRKAIWYRNDPHSTTSRDHYLPLLLSTPGIFDEAQSQEITATDPMFIDSDVGRNLILRGTIAGTVTMETTSKTVTLSIYLYVNGAIYQQWDFSGSFIDIDTNQITFEIDVDESFTLNAGEDIYLKAVTNSSPAPGGDDITTDYQVTTKLSLIEQIDSYPYCRVKSWPIYETLLRCIGKISDKNDCLYSTFFGRTDTQIVQYDADGQLGHIAKGRFIKDSELYPYTAFDYTDKPMDVSLSQLFEGLSAIFCLGLGIETIKGVERVVIEALRYFFDDNVILDLSDRINENAIGKEVDPTRHHSEIESGYNSFEYLTASNLEEFNCKTIWSTIISALDNKLDIVSKLRADTNGINILRSKTGTNEDAKGQDDYFIIDAIRDASAPYWKARTDEGFDTIEGDYGIENYYNLALTPGRAVRRWGAVIRAGLEKNLGTYLRYQASDKNTTLETQLTGEADPVAENSDILVNDLEAPFYLPEIYEFECELRYSEISALLANMKGLVKMSATKYGWLLSFTIGEKENKATFRLLRANLDVITPIEI